MGPMPLWSNHHCATRFLHFWSLSATNLKPPRAPLDCFGHQKQSLHKKKHRNWKTHCIKYTKTHVFVGVHYLAEKHFIALKSSWFTHSLVAADHPRKWTVALSCNDHSRFVWITGHATVWIWWFINMFKQCLNPPEQTEASSHKREGNKKWSALRKTCRFPSKTSSALTLVKWDQDIPIWKEWISTKNHQRNCYTVCWCTLMYFGPKSNNGNNWKRPHVFAQSPQIHLKQCRLKG